MSDQILVEGFVMPSLANKYKIIFLGDRGKP